MSEGFLSQRSHELERANSMGQDQAVDNAYHDREIEKRCGREYFKISKRSWIVRDIEKKRMFLVLLEANGCGEKNKKSIYYWKRREKNMKILIFDSKKQCRNNK